MTTEPNVGAADARSRELRAAGDYLKAVNESFGPQARSASETASALAREEARLIVVGNFAAAGFLVAQRLANDVATNLWFGVGVCLLIAGAMAAVLALRFWATSLSHEATENFLCIRREQDRVSFDLHGQLPRSVVTDENVCKAREQKDRFRGRGYGGMAIAGALSAVGYISLIRAFAPVLGFLNYRRQGNSCRHPVPSFRRRSAR